ncbi:MAG: hypothetical protein PHX34_03505 [Candidatus Shapirobacteria bacterium]|nr:hypothetical protein [Candidatus Shapirobacteria bacterium]
MKKYIVMSFLFLLVVVPALAKGSTETQGQQATANSQSNPAGNNQGTVTTIPIKKTTVTPTGNQVGNQNEVQTQNQGENSQLSVKTQESEQLNQAVTDSFLKVSDQVHQLIETVGAKTGIGQEVRDIAQNQTKLQDEIKSDYAQLNSRGTMTKFFVGSDKKLIQSMEQKMEQNRLMIQNLEELKLQTKNSGDLEQLQETIDLMNYQNTSLQDKIDKEGKINGMFGWLINLFNKN